MKLPGMGRLPLKANELMPLSARCDAPAAWRALGHLGAIAVAPLRSGSRWAAVGAAADGPARLLDRFPVHAWSTRRRTRPPFAPAPGTTCSDTSPVSRSSCRTSTTAPSTGTTTATPRTRSAIPSWRCRCRPPGWPAVDLGRHADLDRPLSGCCMPTGCAAGSPCPGCRPRSAPLIVREARAYLAGYGADPGGIDCRPARPRPSGCGCCR